MADKPIIFSAPMVSALLAGRKTQTRRVVKIKKHLADHTFTGDLVDYYGNGRLGMVVEGSTLVQPIPYAAGDRLWVKETFQTGIWRGQEPQITYRATMEWPWDGPWRSPIFMPRKLSRLTLTVTDVRVQRLQEISDEDAICEGTEGQGLHDIFCNGAPAYLDGYPGCDCETRTPKDTFQRLWNSLHGPDAWDANQWVVALTFDVHRCNIDQTEYPND